MKDIKIDELNTNGVALFTDSESYLRDLSEDELSVKGGGITAVVTTFWCTVAAAGIIIVGAVTASSNGRQKP